MNDAVVWAMFFQATMAMQFHPGRKTPVSFEEGALAADRMLLVYLMRKEHLWLGSLEDSPPSGPSAAG